MLVSRNIKLFYWFNFFTDFILYAPVAILYFAKVSGSFALGMSVFSVTMLTAAIFQIPTGLFSDKFGRKKTLIIGALLYVFSAIFYAIGHYYWMLIIGAFFAGLARSFYSGNNEALLYETLTDMGQRDQYHHHRGRVSSMFQVALAVSALFGGIIANWSFSLVMWISVIPQIFMLIVGLFFIEPQSHLKKNTNSLIIMKESFKQFRNNNKLRLLTIGTALDYALGEAGYQFRSAFVALFWPVWAIGIVSMLSNVGGAISFYLSGKVIDRFKPLKTISFQIILNRLINLIALIFPSFISPLLMSLTSLTFGIGAVAEGVLLQKEYTDQQRATLGSIVSFFNGIFFAIAAVLVGFMADKIGPINTLIVINICMFSVLFFYWKIYKHELKIELQTTNK